MDRWHTNDFIMFTPKNFDAVYTQSPDCDRIKAKRAAQVQGKLKAKHQEIKEYLLSKEGQLIAVWALLVQFYPTDIKIIEGQKVIRTLENLQTAMSQIRKSLKNTDFIVETNRRQKNKKANPVTGYGIFYKPDLSD